SKANFSPPAPEPQDPITAYQPVHDAYVALLRAIQQLTTEYGQAWRQWEPAQADLAQLRAISVLG
ncbi:MAG TPA: hypothetical protein VH593_29930, partial [Ktedonobacteraceae bacterium]